MEIDVITASENLKGEKIRYINYNNQKKDVIVLENGKIVEKYQENDNNKTIEGNIYLGKVINVLPGMGAAFVDIGEEKNAFLHIKDVLPKASEITGNKIKVYPQRDTEGKYIKIKDPKQALLTKYTK